MLGKEKQLKVRNAADVWFRDFRCHVTLSLNQPTCLVGRFGDGPRDIDIERLSYPSQPRITSRLPEAVQLRCPQWSPQSSAASSRQPSGNPSQPLRQHPQYRPSLDSSSLNPPRQSSRHSAPQPQPSQQLPPRKPPLTKSCAASERESARATPSPPRCPTRTARPSRAFVCVSVS